MKRINCENSTCDNSIEVSDDYSDECLKEWALNNFTGKWLCPDCYAKQKIKKEFLDE